MKSWMSFYRWMDSLKPGHVPVAWRYKMGYIDVRVEVDWDGRYRIDRIYFDEQKGIDWNGGRFVSLDAGTRPR